MTKFEGHTPGKWGWFGSSRNGMYLATEHSGRKFVMDFVRQGMRGAQPRFQPAANGMIKAENLCIFEVATDATSRDDLDVYRDDIESADK